MKQRIRLLAIAVCLAAWQVACGGSGGGSINPSPTPKPTVTISASPTTITDGQSSKLTWSSSNATSCTASGSWSGSVAMSGSETVTPSPAGTYTYTLACTGNGGSANASVTVTVNAKSQPLAVTVQASATTVNVSGTVTLSATVTGGAGNATVSWSATAGTISPTTGLSVTYTAPSTVPNPSTVTVTATATDGSGNTASGTVTLTVERVITISVNPSYPIPNSELYSDFGALIGASFSCTGCETGDTLTAQSTYGGETQTTFGSQFLNPWETIFNFVGPGYVPGPISMWITGIDGAKSNTLWLAYDGSENMAVQDPSSGEIYYDYSGNGTQGSFSTPKFKQDGTADGNLQDGGGFGIAVDDKTHDVVFSGAGDVVVDDPSGNQITVVGIPNSSSSTYALAVSASGGLGCATQPTIDSASCFYLPTQPAVVQPFNLPGLPSGSQPTPIKVLDASHVVLYGRGDQTLRWYTISGTTATASGTLQLPEFTATDANYWKTYPATGGWEIVQVGSTLGVMGQVVNTDGTVSQKLALVNNTNQTLIQYVDLPAGTVHIAADPTNNAVVAEYVDFSGTSPILRFERIYVDTGNTILLQSTSNLVPGAGFLVTNDGSQIAVFVEGKADFEPNQ